MTRPTLKSIFKIKHGYFFILHNRQDSDTAVISFGHDDDKFKLIKIAEVSPATYGRTLAIVIEKQCDTCTITRNTYIKMLNLIKENITNGR